MFVQQFGGLDEHFPTLRQFRRGPGRLQLRVRAVLEDFSQYFAGWILGYRVDEDDASIQALVSCEVNGHVVFNVGQVDVGTGPFDNVGSGGFGGDVFRVENANDRSIPDVRVQHKDGLEFGG